MRIALLDDYQGVAERFADWSPLRSVIDAPLEVVAFRDHVDDEGELANRLQGFDVVVAMRERTRLQRSLLSKLPLLRLIVTTGMRNAAIDTTAAAELGITVTGTGGIITPTSELTWGLIFAVLRHIPSEAANLRAGGWQQTVGTGVAGKVLGIVGLGNLGSLVAEAGRAFHMDVVAWSHNLTAERCAEVGATLVSKQELFARSDVVSIHLVLSERTSGLVGEAELRRMKPTAVLINTSRGPIVDESALVRALREEWISGAGLDVFDAEPLPADHPLRTVPNAICTPHLGYVTDDTYELFYRQIVEDVTAFAAGRPMRVVTPAA